MTEWGGVDQQLAERIRRLRGDPSLEPQTAIVIPVNAQGDQENALRVVDHAARYRGDEPIEVVLVVNNYAPEERPPIIDGYRELGMTVDETPDARRPGEAPGFSARMRGLRATTASYCILFDADVQLPHPTPLIDWYVRVLRDGADVAYTPVDYYDLRSGASIWFRIRLHHFARWVKRVLLRIPTTRGSNYAVRRETVLRLYDAGLLADELNVGPTVRRHGGQVAYGSDRQLRVLTSGRMFTPGWRKLPRYFLYRLHYNVRVLPGGARVKERTGRDADPVRRYIDNRPVR